MTETEQLACIDRTLAGDMAAFENLVAQWEASVYRVADGICHDSHHARDVAQDAFVAAYRQLGQFDPHRAQFATWLLTITRNLALKSNRKHQRMIPTRAEFLEDASVSKAPSPEEGLEWKETFAALDAAMEKLPAKLRAAFTLTELEGLSYQEAALIEAVPIGTIRSRINRARQRLRLALMSTPSPLS